MCGIVCLVADTPNLTNIAQSMTDVLYHRGPDHGAVWVSPNHKLALGHRRLAIIDTSHNGEQPMHSPDGNVSIVFNGEIYNFPELKKELQTLGYKFKSNSDTEVLLNGYLAWGQKVVEKLKGMWAFVIYDPNNNSLFISRDHVGMKPLYIYHTSRHLIIASEIKAIIKSGFMNVDVDPDALVEYFTFQNILSEKTLFKDIVMLPAGYCAVYNISSNELRKYQYWDFTFEENNSKSISQFSDEFKDLFITSLKRHLISDVEIGVTLSGGIDSSSIVALASNSIANLQTFTGYFDTSKIDSDDYCNSERDAAKLSSSRFNTTHNERLIAYQDMMDSMPEIVWHLEDPKLAMCYTFYAISHLVSQKVTVNLSGTGGDELFGGYPWRYSLIDNASDFEHFKNHYYSYWSRLIKDNDKSSCFNSNVLSTANLDRARFVFDSIISKPTNQSHLTKALYFELKTFLHGMLMVEDKMGMAYSIETRFPFLDKDLLDFSCSIPSQMKFYNNEAKIVLKRAMNDILPPQILSRKKQGFTPPDKSWYRHELREYIKNLLLGRKSMITNYLQPSFIESVLTRHNNSQQDERLLIWSMVFFEGWLRTFIGNQGKFGIRF